MPDIKRNDADFLIVVWPRWYNRILLAGVYLLSVVSTWAALRKFQGKSIFYLPGFQLLDALLLAVFLLACIYGLFRYGSHHTIVIDKKFKQIESFSNLLLNFNRKRKAFSEVTALSVMRVPVTKAPDQYHIRLLTKTKQFIDLGVFMKEKSALDFASAVSRAADTKIVYTGIWGLGRTGPTTKTD